MLKLVTNETSENHQALLAALLNTADEAYIAVAFLKKSGFSLIRPYIKKDTIFQIVAGINFGITDPAALSDLLALSKKNAGIQPYLIRLDYRKVFHPKIYLVKNAAGYHVIVGSGNLTSGGLSANHEATLYHTSVTKDQIWDEAIALFYSFTHPNMADPLSPLLIAIYRKYFKEQLHLKTKAKKYPVTRGNKFYNLENFKRHLQGMDPMLLAQAFDQKRKRYRQARKTLDDLIARPLTPAAFKTLLERLIGKAGAPGFWASNGMFRHKGDIMKNQAVFCRLIRVIKAGIHKNPCALFRDAKVVATDLYGVGPNYIGEIMLSYGPGKFANINQNPITVLRREGQLDIKSGSDRYDADDYAEYNEIVAQIAVALGLRDMLEVDYFFNEIYQSIKKNKITG
jgi:HKD family nuclease